MAEKTDVIIMKSWQDVAMNLNGFLAAKVHLQVIAVWKSVILSLLAVE